MNNLGYCHQKAQQITHVCLYSTRLVVHFISINRILVSIFCMNTIYATLYAGIESSRILSYLFQFLFSPFNPNFKNNNFSYNITIPL